VDDEPTIAEAKVHGEAAPFRRFLLSPRNEEVPPNSAGSEPASNVY
jgi:hypothetical protein